MNDVDLAEFARGLRMMKSGLSIAISAIEAGVVVTERHGLPLIQRTGGWANLLAALAESGGRLSYEAAMTAAAAQTPREFGGIKSAQVRRLKEAYPLEEKQDTDDVWWVSVRDGREQDVRSAVETFFGEPLFNEEDLAGDA